MNEVQFNILLANLWLMAAFFLSGADTLLALAIGLLWLGSGWQEIRLEKLRGSRP